MDLKLKQLALAVYKKQAPESYDLADLEGTLRETFKELAPNYNAYRENKNKIFALIGEVVDDVMPNRIDALLGQFSEIKAYAQGVRPRFRRKLGRNNVKRFITKVGLGGVYERVRLDSDYIDVVTHALGGSAYVEFEQYLDGQLDFAELTNLIIEGIEIAIYKEIYTALIATYSSLPAANVHSANAFAEAEMRRIITTVNAYGGNANIICTPEFAATIMVSDKFIGETIKNEVRNQGYVGRFYGANVIVLPQSFEDEKNTTKVFNAQYALVVPTGGSADEKIVKVLLEGQTIIEEYKNRDGSMEFQAYKKVGTAVLNTNYYGLYRNTAL